MGDGSKTWGAIGDHHARQAASLAFGADADVGDVRLAPDEERRDDLEQLALVDGAAAQLEVDGDVVGYRCRRGECVDVLRTGVDDGAVLLDVAEVAQGLDAAGGGAGSDRDQNLRLLAHILDALGVGAGAAGYLLKEIRGANLVDAIRQVAAGQSLLDPAVTGRLLQRLRDGEPQDKRLASLTEREREILGLITEGLTNRQIGDRLFLAEKTVKNYVSGLLAKLGMERRTQAAVYGAEVRNA